MCDAAQTKRVGVQKSLLELLTAALSCGVCLFVDECFDTGRRLEHILFFVG
jgi:hypothetical protein